MNAKAVRDEEQGPTICQPDTVTDAERDQLIIAIVNGKGRVTEEEMAPILQAAIDMLHKARIDLALMGLALSGTLAICGRDDNGDLVFQKNP